MSGEKTGSLNELHSPVLLQDGSECLFFGCGSPSDSDMERLRVDSDEMELELDWSFEHRERVSSISLSSSFVLIGDVSRAVRAR